MTGLKKSLSCSNLSSLLNSPPQQDLSNSLLEQEDDDRRKNLTSPIEEKLHELRRIDSVPCHLDGLGQNKKEESKQKKELRNYFDTHFVASSRVDLQTGRRRSLDDSAINYRVMHSVETQVDGHEIDSAVHGHAHIAPILDVRNANGQSDFAKALRNGADWLVSGLVQEIGIDAFKNKNTIGTNFNVGAGNILGFRLDEKVFTSEDKEISEDDLRNTCTKELAEATGSNVVWIQTGGIIQNGSGGIADVIIAPYTDISGGFSATGSFCYSTLQPYALDPVSTPEDLIKNNTFKMPFTAANARKMRAGGQFEMAAQGKLEADGTIGFTYGLGAGPATLGVGTSATVDTNLLREYGLTVISLDGANKVRVKLRDIGQEETSLALRVQAGLLFRPTVLTAFANAIPIFGPGQLKFLAEKLGYHSVEALVTSYTALTLQGTLKAGRKATDLLRFDFDLSKPEAIKAYEDLMHLHAKTAQAVANQSGTGVTLVTAEEREASYSASAHVGLLGQKLLLAEALSNEQQGTITRRDGTKEIMRQSTYTNNFRTPLTPVRRADWQVVTLRDTQTGLVEPFYRLHYVKENRIGDQEEVDQVFRFSHVMKIETDGKSSQQLVQMPWFKAFWSGDARDSINIDIYFTKQGINQIIAATKEEIIDAYLSVAVQLHPIYENFPFISSNHSEEAKEAREIMEEYNTTRENLHWYQWAASFFHPAQLEELKMEYFTHVGRGLLKDRDLLQEATEFAEDLKKLQDVNNVRQVEKLFKKLGSSKGCEYAQTIGTMALLAGKKNTLIHQLCVEGGGAHLKNIDGGIPEDPHEHMNKAINEISDLRKG